MRLRNNPSVVGQSVACGLACITLARRSLLATLDGTKFLGLARAASLAGHLLLSGCDGPSSAVCEEGSGA